MDILLISPVGIPGERTERGLLIPQLALHVIAALTPARHAVRIVEEERGPLPEGLSADLVGISCFTASAPRAYELAARFRAAGARVVLGGIHPSILPEEASRHADAVVVGEAETVWGEVLADAERGALRRVYRAAPARLDAWAPYRTPTAVRKLWMEITPVMTTRGCPYTCEFCSVHRLFGRRIRHVPVAHVVRRIEEAGADVVLFLDDNVIGDPRYARELFAALRPLGIRWGGQASISFSRDAALIREAAACGCRALFVGIETVSTRSMRRMAKSAADLAALGDAIARIRDAGIHFNPSFVFGFDTDTREVFAQTLEFLQRHNVGTAGFNVLTPYPGTAVHERFAREGRLLSTDWRRYNHKNVVFRPARLTPMELHVGRLWVVREFQRFGAFLPRVTSLPRLNRLELGALFLLFNIAYRSEILHDVAAFPALARELFPEEAGPDLASAQQATARLFAQFDRLGGRG